MTYKFEIIKDESFVQEFIDYPAYDNIRKIASVIDGQKNASRKVIHYILKHNVTKPVKTSQIKSKIEEYTQYLHGDITGTVENMAKDYVGTNNINLLLPKGGFGTRLIKDTSASRYTYTCGAPELFKLFDTSDYNTIPKQFFEGEEIEPRYLIPSIPLLLVNGSNGVSTGYAQKIFNRDPNKIIEAIKQKLKDPTHVYDEPIWYRDYTGDVRSRGNGAWTICGKAEQTNTTTVHITEIPFSYNLNQYINVLDTLKEKGIIKSYTDNCKSSFDFVVKFERSVLAKYPDDKLYDVLKLKTNVTENYTAEDENNIVVEFGNVNEILDYFIDFKMKSLQDRKDYLISKYKYDLSVFESKISFISGIIEETLLINNRKRVDIFADLEYNKFIMVDGSYDYLLNMNISSLTSERVESLNKQFNQMKIQLDKLTTMKNSTMWLKELE